MVIVIRDPELEADIAYASSSTQSVFRIRPELISAEGARALSDVLTEIRARHFRERPPIPREPIAG